MSSLIMLVKTVTPSPPPMETIISTFCLFLLKYWLTMRMLVSLTIPHPIPNMKP